jgi:hypothetical protein
MNYCVQRYAKDPAERESMENTKNEWMEGVEQDDMHEWVNQFWILMLYICLSD